MTTTKTWWKARRVLASYREIKSEKNKTKQTCWGSYMCACVRERVLMCFFYYCICWFCLVVVSIFVLLLLFLFGCRSVSVLLPQANSKLSFFLFFYIIKPTNERASGRENKRFSFNHLSCSSLRSFVPRRVILKLHSMRHFFARVHVRVCVCCCWSYFCSRSFMIFTLKPNNISDYVMSSALQLVDS